MKPATTRRGAVALFAVLVGLGGAGAGCAGTGAGTQRPEGGGAALGGPAGAREFYAPWYDPAAVVLPPPPPSSPERPAK